VSRYERGEGGKEGVEMRQKGLDKQRERRIHGHSIVCVKHECSVELVSEKREKKTCNFI
jgi:hypothetical protein